MSFRTEPPTAPLPPIAKQMALRHVRPTRVSCDCRRREGAGDGCRSCGREWPCDVSRLLTTLWGDDIHDRAQQQRDAREAGEMT